MTTAFLDVKDGKCCVSYNAPQIQFFSTTIPMGYFSGTRHDEKFNKTINVADDYVSRCEISFVNSRLSSPSIVLSGRLSCNIRWTLFSK